jgi:hypothetical protein
MSTDSHSRTKQNPAQGVFSDVGGVAVAAILNMLRLVGGELVLLRSRESDPKWFEDAVRKQLDQFTSPTNDPEARAAGIECARYLIEQVLAQIHAQAEIKRTLSPPSTEAGSPADTPKFLLN